MSFQYTVQGNGCGDEPDEELARAAFVTACQLKVVRAFRQLVDGVRVVSAPSVTLFDTCVEACETFADDVDFGE